jgi:hypothetical protein
MGSGVVWVVKVRSLDLDQPGTQAAIIDLERLKYLIMFTTAPKKKKKITSIEDFTQEIAQGKVNQPGASLADKICGMQPCTTEILQKLQTL